MESVKMRPCEKLRCCNNEQGDKGEKLSQPASMSLIKSVNFNSHTVLLSPCPHSLYVRYSAFASIQQGTDIYSYNNTHKALSLISHSPAIIQAYLLVIIALLACCIVFCIYSLFAALFLFNFYCIAIALRDESLVRALMIMQRGIVKRLLLWSYDSWHTQNWVKRTQKSIYNTGSKQT